MKAKTLGYILSALALLAVLVQISSLYFQAPSAPAGSIDVMSSSFAPQNSSLRDLPVPPNPPQPAPFERLAEIVTLDEVIEQWDERGWKLYLPTWLPRGLNLTAVWAVVRDGEVGNIVILVYSETNETRISPAELTIEVQPLPAMPWRVVDPTKERFIKIGNWTVYVNERAFIGEPEHREKFGVEYCV